VLVASMMTLPVTSPSCEIMSKTALDGVEIRTTSDWLTASVIEAEMISGAVFSNC